MIDRMQHLDQRGGPVGSRAAQSHLAVHQDVQELGHGALLRPAIGPHRRQPLA